MAKQVIGIGAFAEDGTGDGLRDGMDKVNDNFTENYTAIALNTAKVSNISTDLSEGTSTVTTVDVNSSDGTNATLVAASTSRAGLLTKAKFDEIDANTAAIAASFITTIVNIGDWNMNSTGSGVNKITVAHSVADFTKIRRVTAFVRNDGDTSYYPLDTAAGLALEVNGGVGVINSTTVALIAATGEIFDNASFSTTSYNRGYIIIDAIA